MTPVGSAAHAARFEVGDEAATRIVVSDPRHEACRLAQRCAPCAEVGRLAAATDRDRGRRVVVGFEWALGHDPDVHHEVAEGDDHDLTRITAYLN